MSHVQKLSGRVAVVVGGTGGIGREVVRALTDAGAAVVVAGRSQAAAEAFLQELRVSRPDAALGYEPADIRRYEDCRQLFASVVSAHGRLDAVVNCANPPAAGLAGRFDGLDPTQFDAFLSASLTTLFKLCHAALPALAAQGGAIVTFASDSGKVAAPNQTMVGASRAAIMMFTRSLALETAASGVRVNCVSTSFVKDTPVFERVMGGPLASRGHTAAARAGLGLPGPGDVAQLALFLCCDASAHLTGQVISVNGGVSAA
jgi:3-oxoacyl-[acyl-carrier protein] reductase